MTRHFLGIDVGATKMTAVLYSEDLESVLGSTTVATDASRGWPAVQDTLVDLVRSIIDADTVAIGMGVPGPIQKETQTVTSFPNIPGSLDVHPAVFLQEHFDIPCFIDNDARCFTLGEATFGAGKGEDVVVGVTVGSGLGGGIVIRGNPFHGQHGYAGECGHTLLSSSEGTMLEAEALLSGSAIVRRFGVPSASGLLRDPSATVIHTQLHHEFAQLFVNLVYFVDPGIIVIGGGAGLALASHLTAIQSVVQTMLLPGVTAPKILSASLPDSATRGSAILARHYCDAMGEHGRHS